MKSQNLMAGGQDCSTGLGMCMRGEMCCATSTLAYGFIASRGSIHSPMVEISMPWTVASSWFIAGLD